jgi:prepilin-type N-terminal cleavage/methylation domain-containing protein
MGVNRSRQDGFSILELLMVLALTSITLSFIIGGFRQAQAIVQGDASLRIVQWQFKLARETAINQRRSVEIRFTPPNFLSVVRRNIPGGETLISTAVLEHNTQFLRFSGQPDTPDGFGGGAAINFGAAASYMFTADGMFTDQAGNPLNGTVFIGQPNKAQTARALTVFGPTARVRGYRWNGSQWK